MGGFGLFGKDSPEKNTGSQGGPVQENVHKPRKVLHRIAEMERKIERMERNQKEFLERWEAMTKDFKNCVDEILGRVP